MPAQEKRNLNCQNLSLNQKIVHTHPSLQRFYPNHLLTWVVIRYLYQDKILKQADQKWTQSSLDM